MKVGKKIRYHRLRLRMTQSELAKGIISVSYLSKIENCISTPAPEILDLLFKKLNITSHSNKTNKIFDLCERWIMSLLQNKKDVSVEIYKELLLHSKDIANTSLINLFEIHKLHYFIITRQSKEIKEQLNLLQKLSKKFNGEEKYYWYKILGNYYFSRLLYSKSLNLYLKAKNYLNNNILFLDEEKGNLFYLIAVSSSKLRKSYLVDIYANKALHYYQGTYQMKRCANCHILLGILYHRIGELDKSLKSYQLACTIAENIGDSNILSISNQNMGKLYSVMNKTDKAIEFYLKSYHLRHDSSLVKKIIPISSLMKEYYKKRDYSAAKKWLEIGLTLSRQLTPLDSIYVYEFEVYNYLIKNKGLDKSFEKLVLQEIIPFLKERKLYYEKHIYLQIIANYYFSNRKYKLAAQYFSYASNILTNIFKD